MKSVSTHILGVDELLAQLMAMTPAVRNELVVGMNEATIRLQGYIVSEKLSGDPLHRRSGHLSDSIQQDVESQPEAVTGRVSTNLDYARVHEDGGEFWIPEHYRLRKNSDLRKLGAINARTFHALMAFAPEQAGGMVRGHYATYPQRAFMVPSYQALKNGITQTLRDHTLAGLNAGAASGQ